MRRNNSSFRHFLVVALLISVLAIGWVALSADEVTPTGGSVPPAPTVVYPKPTQFQPLIFNQPILPTPPPDLGGDGE